jgi:hypothetical protein
MRHLRTSIILILACLFTPATYAQATSNKTINAKDLDSYFNNVEGSPTYITTAIKSGLFVSRQSFQIYDEATGDIFGRNGKEEFGVQYSLGVKVPNGFVLSDKAVCPWKYDNGFFKYRDKYNPISYKASYTGLDKVEYDSLSYSLTKMDELVDSTLYRFDSDTFHGDGFILDSSTGDKSGWVVWITSADNADFETAPNISYSVFKKAVKIERQLQTIDIEKPSTVQNVIGGIYIVPSFYKIGVIELRLSGILAQNGEKWQLIFPFVDEKAQKHETKKVSETEQKPDTTNNDDNSELTPINKSKKKTKR